MEWLKILEHDNMMQALGSVLLVAALWVITWLMRRLVTRFGKRMKYPVGRIYQISFAIKIAAVFIGIVLLSSIWGFSEQGFLVFASSILALVGVALFAVWSVLSNITAAMVLFFHAPFHVGDRIRVLDVDNTVTGRVQHMGIFFITLRDGDGNEYTLPNNFLMQRTVIRMVPGKEAPVDRKHCKVPD